MKSAFLSILIATSLTLYSEEHKDLEQNSDQLVKIQMVRGNEMCLSEMLPIVQCSFSPSKYEEILLSQLRNTQSSTKQFRKVSEKIGDLLVNKVIECLPIKAVEIETPIAKCLGMALASKVEFVSIMRSGDALLETFLEHFPEANVSKFLIQRDERTAKPQFKYMKISPELTSGNHVVITEPMIATGGTLDMVISMLKAKGVKEENIIVASICVAPEGLILLNDKFPKIKVVMTALDEKLNERKFIVPGIGDFGDRYFGTGEQHTDPVN